MLILYTYRNTQSKSTIGQELAALCLSPSLSFTLSLSPSLPLSLFLSLSLYLSFLLSTSLSLWFYTPIDAPHPPYIQSKSTIGDKHTEGHLSLSLSFYTTIQDISSSSSIRTETYNLKSDTNTQETVSLSHFPSPSLSFSVSIPLILHTETHNQRAP